MSPAPIVNVLFHGIGRPARELEPGEDRFWISTDQFHELLDELAGWPNVLVSFDDGNASDVEIALPALVSRQLSARFFVLAGRLGVPGSLDADGVRELRRHGMVIGSHGMHHRSWRRLAPEQTYEEFMLARMQLADVVCAPVELAACPFGAYDRVALRTLRQYGYARVYTSDRRRGRPGAWLQPRYSVRRDETPVTLRRQVLQRPPLEARARSAVRAFAKRWR